MPYRKKSDATPAPSMAPTLNMAWKPLITARWPNSSSIEPSALMAMSYRLCPAPYRNMTTNTSQGLGNRSRSTSDRTKSQPALTDVARAPTRPMMRPASSSMATEPAVAASSVSARRCSSNA